jgi:DNA modification methylase
VIHWQDDHLTLYGGDCRAVLEELPAESVHCVVTSPPYWGLRDYGHGEQLGLEPTPEAYVENMVAVFREVRRVLRADGTLWLNLGDSYAAQRGGTTMPAETLAGGKGGFTDDGGRVNRDRHDGYSPTRNASAIGLKHKDLVGIPWRVAFALQADGWYLRSDIIWSKPNPMPESVTDRPTKAHEYLFLLTKSPRYYFDAEAVREAGDEPDRVRRDRIGGANGHTVRHSEGGIMGQVATRNLRSVWTIATEPYPGAHFATFPRKLVEPCVKAGTSERGVCPECGAPWVRVVEKSGGTWADRVEAGHPSRYGTDALPARDAVHLGSSQSTTVAWRPTCRIEKFDDVFSHDAGPVPAVVLDPFAGSGTTLLVAQALGRRGVGIDLNPDYLKQALARNAQTPLGLIG